MSQFDLFESRRERDKGIDRVLSRDPGFSQQVIDFIQTKLPIGWVGIGEDIRMLSKLKPVHSNAWGGAISAAVKRKILQYTGYHRQMKDRSSHARESKEYRRVR